MYPSIYSKRNYESLLWRICHTKTHETKKENNRMETHLFSDKILNIYVLFSYIQFSASQHTAQTKCSFKGKSIILLKEIQTPHSNVCHCSLLTISFLVPLFLFRFYDIGTPKWKKNGIENLERGHKNKCEHQMSILHTNKFRHPHSQETYWRNWLIRWSLMFVYFMPSRCLILWHYFGIVSSFHISTNSEPFTITCLILLYSATRSSWDCRAVACSSTSHRIQRFWKVHTAIIQYQKIYGLSMGTFLFPYLFFISSIKCSDIFLRQRTLPTKDSEIYFEPKVKWY